MNQSILKIDGLKTNPSPHTEAPGSLKVAENIVIDSPNTATCRRGFTTYGDEVSLESGDVIKKIFTFNDTLLIHYYNKIAYDSDDAGTWVEYSGFYNDPDTDIGMQSVKSNQSIYFTTDAGVVKLDSVTGSIVSSGVPKALGGFTELTETTGFLANDTQVVYRVLWGIRDANNILHYGAVSDRIIAINDMSGSETTDVNITFYIPDGIAASHFYQVYRSKESASAATEPNDELYLMYEDNPTSAEITAGSVIVNDITDEVLLGDALYTNPSQDGIGANNDVPPLCKDMANYKNHVFYANTKSRHRKTIAITAVGGANGIQVDDTITIGGVTYTAKAVENTAAGNFLLDTTAATVAEKIANTAKSLVKVINLYSANTISYGYYTSNYDELPGKILVERRDLTDTSFAFTVSANGTAFNPVLPTSGTSVASDNEARSNRVYFSKQMQPEAVPLLQYVEAGSANSDILRIVALKNSVFIFKNDGEIYRLTGEDRFSFQVNLFESNVRLYGPKTAVVLSNEIYCMTSQGIVSISDIGVKIKSYPIEDTIIKFLSTSLNPSFVVNSYGIAYESDRKYILSDGTESYVYNVLTDSWTKWTLEKDFGMVASFDDKLYWSDSAGYIYQEKKTYTKYDFSDNETDVTVVSYSFYSVVLLGSDMVNVSVGQTLKQGTDRESYITAVDNSTNTITVSDLAIWDAGAAVVTDAIDCKLQWLPIDVKNPTMMKRFTKLMFTFRAMNKEFDVYLSNNFIPAEQTWEISALTTQNGWGNFTWGSVAWGGRPTDNYEMRTYIPLAYQRALWIDLRIETSRSNTNFSLNGVSVEFLPMSDRFIR